MNRNKLKIYAPRARREFIKAVTDRAAHYGLNNENIEPVTEQGDVALITGRPFPRSLAKKRKRLEERIRRESFDQVMEAMAYTWFNRFVAIRYMELHGYLDHGYRVLSTTDYSDSKEVKDKKRGTTDYTDNADSKDKKAITTNHTNQTNDIPDILKYAEHVDLPGLDREKVIELKLAGDKDEELYRMLLIAQCNALHKAMPFLFEKLDHETELLLPENLLHSDSLIRKLVNEIPEDEWQEIEIIGWLYQFYISEKKDQVIGKVVKSEDIPAATQLFTPNWIVKYMVQNTLGRQWLATYPNSPLKEKMAYYIEPAAQTPEVEEQLKAITPDSLNPEELTLLDPACGSGHILVEAYDLLKAIYQERGYRAGDIPRLILEKNLYGLEIDDRAAQLAAFALMMKARTDDRRVFDNGTRPHVVAIQDSPDLADEALEVFTTNYSNSTNGKGVKAGTTDYTDSTDKHKGATLVSDRDIRGLLKLFEHGKTFGSLIRVPEDLAEKLLAITERVMDVLVHGDMFGKNSAERLMPIVKQAEMLARKYDSVVTNPPYMGGKGMNPALKKFAKDQFPDSKSDLFSMFIERNLDFDSEQGAVGMITMQSWMFLSSFERLRESVLGGNTILSMAHLGARAFDSIGGEVVSTTAFVLGNGHYPEYKGGYFRLVDGNSEAEKDDSLHKAIQNPDCGWFYRASAVDFKKIPGSPIAYWVSEAVISLYDQNLIGETFNAKEGVGTRNDDVFIRMFWEVPVQSISPTKRWILTDKAGDFRRWYMGFSYVMDWENDGYRIKNYRNDDGTLRSRPQNTQYLFEEGVTWGKIGSGLPSFRWRDKGFGFNDAAPTLFGIDVFKTLGQLNSVVIRKALTIRGSTLNITTGVVSEIPLLNLKEDSLARDKKLIDFAITLTRTDWDSYETSWDFTRLPLLDPDHRKPTLKATYTALRAHWQEMTLEMKRLEEENNRIFIEAYGLQDELTPDVPLEEITLTCNPRYRYGGNKSEEELEELLLTDTMKELISYAVGCMMGRYSLDAPGLIYAHSGNERFREIYYQKHGKTAPSQNNTHSYNSCDSWSSSPNQNNSSDSWLLFPPDEDGIIPITDTDWFEDDGANRVVELISVAWPEEHLEENLKFIADTLSPRKGESPRDTIRRYLTTGFYKHHMKMYKKRPIYWLFTSGKQRAFQCLVYLHRYNEATLSRMRTEYVIPLQGKINARIDQLKEDAEAATSTPHRRKLERERDKLIKQQGELQAFDEKLRHYADQRIRLDLDDGVKVNYGKFGDLLAEVQAVTGKK